MAGRVHYFDGLRAVSVVIIVVSHCFNEWIPQSVPSQMLFNGLIGGTAAFVFISGFFLHSVYARKYDYRSFVWTKVKNVVVPYLVLSGLYISLFTMISSGVPFSENVADGTGLLQSLSLVMFQLRTGAELMSYWYIPFYIFLVLLTPLFMDFMKVRRETQILIILVMLGVATYTHRSVRDVSQVQDILYFAGFYMLGIFYSLNRTRLEKTVSDSLFVSLAIWIALVWGMSVLGQLGNPEKMELWVYDGFDFMVPQKLFMIFMLLGLLKRYADKPIAALQFLADISFPLFFIHPLVIEFLRAIGVLDALPEGMAGFVLLASTVLGTSIVLAVVGRHCLGRYSRWVIGAPVVRRSARPTGAGTSEATTTA